MLSRVTAKSDPGATPPPPSSSVVDRPEHPVAPPVELEVTETRIVRRLGWGLLGDAVMGFVAAEKGFLFTMRAFLREPRSAFEDYLGQGRMRYSNPIKLVIFLAALATFLNYQFGAFVDVSEGFANRAAEVGEEADRTAEKLAALDQFFRQNYNLMLLATLPVLALVSRLLYWKRAYNWMEHLALNSFIFAFTTVAYLLHLPVFVLFPSAGLVYLLVALFYQTWVYRRVLGPGWPRAVLATLISYAAYMVVFVGALAVWIILQTP